MSNLEKNKLDIINIIQTALDELHDSAIIENRVFAEKNTPIIGDGAELDSVAFITLISDIESRVCEKFNKDIFIILSDIQSLDDESSAMNVDMLTNYLLTIISKE